MIRALDLLLLLTLSAHSFALEITDYYKDSPDVALINNLRLKAKYPKDLPVHSIEEHIDGKYYSWESPAFKDPEVTMERRYQVMTDRPVSIQVHPEFDAGSAAEPMKNLTQSFSEKREPHYVLYYNLLGAANYKRGEPSYEQAPKYLAPEGVHSLEFPASRRFVMSGGNFGACLCTSVNSVLMGSRHQQELQFDFPMDATFDSACDETAEVIRKKSSQFTAPQAVDNLGGNTCKHTSLTLREIYDFAGPDLFLKYVVSRYSEENQYRHCLGPHPLSEYTIEIALPGKHPVRIGSGKRKLTLKLWENTESLLKNLTSERSPKFNSAELSKMDAAAAR